MPRAARLRQRGARVMFRAMWGAGTGARGLSFPAFVAATFVHGWVLGLLTVLRGSRMVHSPGWLMMTSGWGYILVMLVPIGCGIVVVRLAARLAVRGWGSAGVGLALLGLAGAVGGLLFGT